MTRQEFIDDITYWYELERVADDFGYENMLEDIYSQDSYDDQIMDSVKYNFSTPDEVRDFLDEIPRGYDRYEYCDGRWYGTDSGDTTFEEYKSRLLEEMDYNDEWDEEDTEDNNDEDNEEVEPEPPLEEEAIDISEVLLEAVDITVRTPSAMPSFEEFEVEVNKIFKEETVKEVEEKIKSECSDEEISQLLVG